MWGILFIFIRMMSLSNFMKIVEILILFQYVTILSIEYYRNKKITFLFLFLLVFGLYNLPLVFNSLVYSKEYFMDMVYILVPTKASLIESLKILSTFLLGFGLYVFIIPKKINKKIIQNSKIKLVRISLLMLLILTFIVIYKTKIQLDYTMRFGYLSVLNGELDKLNYPIWTKGSMTIYPIIFYLFLSFYPSKKYFYLGSFVYLLGNFMMALRGTRMLFVTQLLIILVYYINFYNVKLKLLKLSIGGVGTIIFLNILKIKRSGELVELTIFNHIFKFIEEQGYSFVLIPLYLDYKNFFNNRVTLSIFSEYLDIFNLNSNTLTEEYVKQVSSISINLIYKIMPEVYLNGGGLGGNFLMDVHALGGNFLVFISGLVLAKICNKISNNEFKYPFVMFPVIATLLMAPRGGLLLSLFWIKIIIVYLIFKVFILKKII